jgi:AraC-like DNA-binding protein
MLVNSRRRADHRVDGLPQNCRGVLMLDSDFSWEMFLRGGVAGLLLFHVFHLAMPGARPAARAALGMFTLSVLAYLFCQQADVLLSVPRPLAYALIALCVSSTAWMWVAARALFNDDFGFSAPVVATALGMVSLGLVANVPYLPEAAEVIAESAVRTLSRLHAAAMLAFTAAALWEIVHGWNDDLVEPRRAARRWVAMGIGLYATLALVIELALRGQAISRLLPALHVAGIGAVTLALALFVARRSLDDVLGIAAPAPTTAPEPNSTVPRLATPGATNARESQAITRLTQLMTEQRVYRREGLTLGELAKSLGVGETALRSQINQELGYRNFNDFLHHHRLQEAAARLVSDDLPILTIALDCGYGSIGPFNRAFKQRMGMTPSEFRGAARLSKGSSTN